MQRSSVSLRLTRHGKVHIKNIKIQDAQREDKEEFEELITAISGMSTDPVLTDSFLFFHSYRKVWEKNPEIGRIADKSSSSLPNWRSRYNFSPNRFKMIVLKSLMQQASLFDLSEAEDPDTAIEQLNKLLNQYAGGKISKKLVPRPDDTIEFRIQSQRCEDPFSFDGLSSGQKEIISTLFLIWYYTQKRPRVVLIDEPELHLNAQWHRSFINTLLDLAPDNQYIIATHSEDVMDSVEPDRRVLLSE